MRIAIDNFRGEIPRVTPRGLPDSAAQAAVNARLLSGDLTAWRQFGAEVGLVNTGPVQSIYRLADTVWLSWDSDVDVARGTTGGDTAYRTYITGPDEYTEPRVTTLALASGGGAPYPSATRPLGVPAPDSTPTTSIGTDPSADDLTVDVLDVGDSLATVWNTYAEHPSEVIQSVLGGYALGIENATEETTLCYLRRYYDIAASVSINVSADVMFRDDFEGAGAGAGPTFFVKQVRLLVGAPASGAMLAVAMDNDGFLKLGTISAWDSHTFSTKAVSALVATVAFDTWYTFAVRVTLVSEGVYDVTASVYAGSALLTTVSSQFTITLGNYVGGMLHLQNTDDTRLNTVLDNILVQAAGVYDPTLVATAYVFTFVNDLGQESAPSLPSATLTRPDGVTVTVTTAVAVPSGVSSDYGITTKRIYRAVTGNAGTAFQFVAEIPLAQADYVDGLTDSELGAVLASDLWVLPPDDLRGILALPNGVMAGFSQNQLCLSAQNYPHAWPVEYRLNTDTAIVSIGNVDNAVVIGTESHVYVAVGNDPAAYSMSKSEVPYACVSKRSLAYLTGVGVVFAGTDGIMAVAGVGQIRNLTEGVFTLRQWQALVPSSIVAVAHNDIYWMAYDTGTAKGCYAIDARPNGFGVVEMAFHFTAAWVDPKTDKFYLVLDEDNEPDDASLPEHPSIPLYLDGTTVYEFEGGAGLMNYRWRSKLWLAPPTAFSIAQVRAESYDNLLVRFYADGVQLYEVAVSEETEFVLPMADSSTQFEIEILGTDPVRVVQMAEDVLELG